MKKLLISYCENVAELSGIEHPYQQQTKLDIQWHENSFIELFNSIIANIPQPKTGSFYVPRLVRSIPVKGGGTVLT